MTVNDEKAEIEEKNGKPIPRFDAEIRDKIRFKFISAVRKIE